MKNMRDLAKLFVDSRFKGISIMHPTAITSIAEAYQLQREIIDLNESENPLGKFIGWKIGATSEAVQSKLGFGPFYGPLFENSMASSGATVSMKSLGPIFRAAEGEIAFRMKQDFPMPENGVHSVEDMVRGISDVYPAIELASARIERSSPEGIVADFALNGCNILGNGIRLDEMSSNVLNSIGECLVSIYVNGHDEQRGEGNNVMGNPLVALAWLANALNDNGQMLRKDQIVLTGAIAVHTACHGGDNISVTFTGLPLGQDCGENDHDPTRVDSVVVSLLP